jgi:hypothetical protein
MIAVDTTYPPAHVTSATADWYTLNSTVQTSDVISSKRSAADEYLTGPCLDASSVLIGSAFNQYSPVPTVLSHLGYKRNKTGGFNAPEHVIESITSFVIGTPKNGKVKAADTPHVWDYVANKGYEGKDRVVYLVEIIGRRFKVTVDIFVQPMVNEEAPACPNIFQSKSSLNDDLSTFISVFYK